MSSSTTSPSPYSYNPLHRSTPTPSSSHPPKLVPPTFKYLIRICSLSLFLTLSILVYQSSTSKASPWFRTSNPTLFTTPPSPLSGFRKPGPVPTVKGCQNVEQTKLEPREKGVILLLVREEDIVELKGTLLNFEEKFNKNFKYPYLFLATPELSPSELKTIPSPGFSTSFRSSIASFLPATATILYDTVPVSSWSLPSHLNATEIREGFARMEKEGVQYAGREGYHHMCRFYSGEWVWGEKVREFDWYWRLEPGVRFYNTITYDPFRFLSTHKKVYGFLITLTENLPTIPTLFSTLQAYSNRIGLDKQREEGGEGRKAIWEFVTRDRETGLGGKKGEEKYNLCHFWTNFEIGDLRFFRSESYQALFRELDAAGGFYTERWGDAPIRSLALALLSDVDSIHYFEDFAYKHDWYLHCPSRESGLGCELDCPKWGEGAFDIDNDYWTTCLPNWREAAKLGSHWS